MSLPGAFPEVVAGVGGGGGNGGAVFGPFEGPKKSQGSGEGVSGEFMVFGKCFLGLGWPGLSGKRFLIPF